MSKILRSLLIVAATATFATSALAGDGLESYDRSVGGGSAPRSGPYSIQQRPYVAQQQPYGGQQRSYMAPAPQQRMPYSGQKQQMPYGGQKTTYDNHNYGSKDYNNRHHGFDRRHDHQRFIVVDGQSYIVAPGYYEQPAYVQPDYVEPQQQYVDDQPAEQQPQIIQVPNYSPAPYVRSHLRPFRPHHKHVARCIPCCR